MSDSAKKYFAALAERARIINIIEGLDLSEFVKDEIIHAIAEDN